MALPDRRDRVRRARCSPGGAGTCRAAARTRARVDWGQSAALLVRREAAAQVGWMDPEFFVYSDEVDFQKRLADAGWHSLYVPAARAIHHEQLATGALPERRIVEHARGRDRYMRKHHGRARGRARARALTAWTYALQALAGDRPARPRPARATAPTPRRRCAPRAARASPRRRRRYNAARRNA